MGYFGVFHIQSFYQTSYRQPTHWLQELGLEALTLNGLSCAYDYLGQDSNQSPDRQWADALRVMQQSSVLLMW